MVWKVMECYVLKMKLALAKAMKELLYFLMMQYPEQTAKDYFNLYSDWIFEIGLTPNRMDAMSHLGVAKDVCAYLAHHNNKDIKVILPFKNNFKRR